MLRPGPGANKFEKEVFELFEKFHMKGYIEELAGGPRNKLDIAEQVDVSFRLLTDSAEYFFIVECKDPEDPENLKLKSSVEQLKVRYDLVEKITKPRNFPAGTIIPVLAVNVSPDEIRTTGAIELLMNPRPYPITRDHIDYYKQLMNSYGEEYTFPLFLYEIFQIRLNYGEPLSIPALKTERFGKTLYTFQMPAAILLKIAYVHRATSTNIPNQAYQRMLDPARLRNIAEKLKQNSFETNFPNNIIVSADSSDCTFTPNEGSADVGILKLRNRYASLRVVDGQHRLYSFLYVDGLRDQFQLVVSALEGLSQEEQSVVFASVNYYSKRVTPDLIDYLFSLESRRGKIGRAALICKELSEQENVFDKDRLYLGFEKSRKGRYLGLHAIVRVLTDEKYKLINEKGTGRIEKDKDDIETPKLVLKEYFDSIRYNFRLDWNKGKEGFVKTSNGIAIFLGLLSRIADKEGHPERLDTKIFDKYLRKLKGTKWRMLREQKLSSDAARHDVIKAFAKRMRL